MQVRAFRQRAWFKIMVVGMLLPLATVAAGVAS